MRQGLAQGQIPSWKGKGNDKGNNKCKDETSDKFDRWCNTCGKYGHRAESCWHVKERNVHEVSGRQTEGDIYEHSAVISEVAGIPRGDRQSLVANEDQHDWVFAVHRRETIAVFGREGIDILID